MSSPGLSWLLRWAWPCAWRAAAALRSGAALPDHGLGAGLRADVWDVFVGSWFFVLSFRVWGYGFRVVRSFCGLRGFGVLLVEFWVSGASGF